MAVAAIFRGGSAALPDQERAMRQLAEFPNLHIVDHPLVQHKLSAMRDRKCPSAEFRRLLREIAMLMGYELTRDLPVSEQKIETPLEEMRAPHIAGKKLAIVPILRAGIGMADGLLDLVPLAKTGHLGLARDPETRQPVEYLVKLPTPKERLFVLVDPMLATGNSAAHAVSRVLEHGVAPGRIRLMALVAAPEGVRRFNQDHPDIPVYVAALDERLDDKAYIRPGLGDAGDRLFGT